MNPLKEKEKLRMAIPNNIQKKLNSFLHSSEKVLYSYKGQWGTHAKGRNSSVISSNLNLFNTSNKRQWGSPWLIITNERILIFGKGIISVDIREIPLENIKSIDYEQGILTDIMTLYAHSSVDGITFHSIDRKYTSKFPRLIKELMKKEPLKQKDSSEDPLKILKLRFAKGELSKTEFEKMKKMLIEE